MQLDKVFAFQIPKKILFGVGISENVGLEAKELGKSALLLTDKTLGKMEMLRRIEEALSRESIEFEVFSEIEAEPSLDVAEAVATVVRRRKFDMVIGVGGGSVLDMAKIAAMAATNPGPIEGYVGVNLVKRPSLSKVLLPTTAGTGSEVTNIAMLILARDEIKAGIVSPYMLGDTAMVDPVLTYALPQRVTGSTGLDALSHALETLMSVESNPITDSLALQATTLIFSNLHRAFEKGDPESRYAMSLGSLMVGMAFGNSGVCLGHAIAYSFAATYHVPHGVSCGLVLPYVFQFNAPDISPKLPYIAKAMHLPTGNMKTEEVASSITSAIFELIDKLRMPRRLRDIGVPREALPKMTEKVLSTTRLIKRNPRVVTKEEASKIIEKMW